MSANEYQCEQRNTSTYNHHHQQLQQQNYWLQFEADAGREKFWDARCYESLQQQPQTRMEQCLACCCGDPVQLPQQQQLPPPPPQPLPPPPPPMAPVSSELVATGSSVAKTMRVTHHRREHKRTVTLNRAFDCLRNCIPHIPKDTKLSKKRILQLAIQYIGTLNTLLTCEQDMDGLKSVAETSAINHD